jgi:hypothetical protein
VRLTTKLLGYLHRVFNKDPMAVLALRIRCDSGKMTWTVSDGTLTLTPVGGSAKPLTLDLDEFTIQELSQFIARQVGYSVPFQDMSVRQGFSALVLLDASGDISQSNGDHLFAYTNILYAYINANASELELAQSQIFNMLAQMSTLSAQGEFLDLQGSQYLVPRNPLELDPAYSPRIISNVLLPSSNNIGMAIALEAQFPGTQVVITDAVDNSSALLLRDGTLFFNSEFVHNSNSSAITDGLFDVTFSFNFSGPISFSEYAPLVISAVNKYRAGGTFIRNMFLKNGLTASVPITNLNIGSILVTVFDLPVVPVELIVTEGGQDVTTQSGIDIQAQ